MIFVCRALKKYGVDEKDIPSICAITENKNNPVKLSMMIGSSQEILVLCA